MRLNLINIIIIGLCHLSASAQINKEQLNCDDFKSYLKKDFNYESLVETFGQPVKEIENGIFIYVYDLYDSTKIVIGYSDVIIYAKHTDKDNKILDELLINSEPKKYHDCIEYYFKNYQSDSIEKPVDEIFEYNKGLTFRNNKVIDTFYRIF